MVEQASLSSCEYEKDIDEFIKSGFTKKKPHIVDCSSIDGSPFIMECKLSNIIELGRKPGSGNLILGEVLCFHINNDILERQKEELTQKFNANIADINRAQLSNNSMSNRVFNNP